MLSVVLPAYKEAMVEKSAETITALLKENRIDREIIFVDDGSKDHTWTNTQSVSNKTEMVRGIHFSRSFGLDQAAILAGLAAAKGN